MAMPKGRGMMLPFLVAASHVVLAGEVHAGGTPLSTADEATAVKAAGYVHKGKHWRGGCDDRSAESYMPPVIEVVRDLNGDGRSKAAIMEDGTYCYGNTG
jgi:hypothetical protein